MNNPNPIDSNRVSWRDSNMALVGSDLDHKIKQAAAASEPQWTGVGETVQLRVWRIEHFIVKPWPRSKYGKVRGRSYRAFVSNVIRHCRTYYFIAFIVVAVWSANHAHATKLSTYL